MRPLVVLALLAGFTSVAPVPKSLKKAPDERALVGTWKCFNENGQTSNNVFLQTFTFAADGGLRITDRDGHTSEWAWSIDAGQTPRQLKWVAKPPASGASECVYHLDGDSLKLAYILRGRVQPEQLDAGQGYYVFQMTRDTPAK